jgi:hypothetical protein
VEAWFGACQFLHLLVQAANAREACYLKVYSKVKAHICLVVMSLGRSTLLTVNIYFIITQIVRPSRGLALLCSRDSLRSNPEKITFSKMINVMEEGMESTQISHGL